MFMEIFTVVALLALGAFCWWYFRSQAALARKREEEHREIGRHDHARAHEMAKLQSEVQRTRGEWWS
jgi:hypothetical protein